MTPILFKINDLRSYEIVEVLAKQGGVSIVRDEEGGKICHRSDEEIARAIERLLGEFAVKTQWVAIYRILVDYYGFPKPLYEFYNRIQKMMPRCQSKFACTYQAIQKGIGYDILTKHYEEWKRYKPEDSGKSFRRQLHTAERFLKLLGEG